MSDPARDLLVCAAAVLDQGRIVDRLSRLLTAAALIGLLFCPVIPSPPSWLLVGFAMLVAFAGFAEIYFAIRVGFDAALFKRLASAPEAPDFAGIDAALTGLGLRRATQAGRSAALRVAGARRLFRFQILALVAQVLSVLAGAGLALTWR